MSSTKFVFFSRSEKQDGRPGLWLAETFRLLLWNCWKEFNETWQEARSQRFLPSLCFSGHRKNKMAALVSDWLRHFITSPWNHWMEFNETWQEARSQRPLPSCVFRADLKNKMAALASDGWDISTSLKTLNRIQRNLTGSKISMSSTRFVFFGPIAKQDGRPGLWLAETFSTSALNTLNGMHRNLTGSKMSTSSTKFVFFWADRTNKMAALADSSKRWHIVLRCTTCGSLGLLFTYIIKLAALLVHLSWRLKCTIVIMRCPSVCVRLSSLTFHIFDFSSETAERNSTKLDRK